MAQFAEAALKGASKRSESLVPQSRDETHGNDAPRRFTNPGGVEFGLAPSWYRRGLAPSGSIAGFVGRTSRIDCCKPPEAFDLNPHDQFDNRSASFLGTSAGDSGRKRDTCPQMGISSSAPARTPREESSTFVTGNLAVSSAPIRFLDRRVPAFARSRSFRARIGAGAIAESANP